jgi:hypothetical protein
LKPVDLGGYGGREEGMETGRHALGAGHSGWIDWDGRASAAAREHGDRVVGVVLWPADRRGKAD